ncbi:DUF6177 family protein [Streptomyces sp. NBC_00557]|uniref:DUF6177 family protein n=1 Tax=Streptomyces sp. NBC_00557 TaxID=2975776 RepID=UPI002E8124B6|nr:DUF6177 family protein [Streptomyces sp. NBC_00557]WUC35638.1 DUF6177 family protein [Streptomyces sp. NBC_00557]
MPQDVIALTPQMPDIKTLLAALHAGGPDLRVNRAGGGSVAQLCTDDGKLLVSVEAPRYLQVPGETERLLGPGVQTEGPVWWTEVRASTAIAEARLLAGSVAGRLTTLLGGITWPPEAAHTDVVTVPATGEATVPPADVDVLTDADVLTDKSVIVIYDRPVVAATTWLTEAVRTVAQGRRELYLVTSPNTRLSLPTRTVLERMPARWVVRHPENGYYDGLSGAVLRWHDGRFTPAADNGLKIADVFQPPPGKAGERQLLLSIRTIHPAQEHLILGGALEDAWQTLTGLPPAGWATAEPVNVPWSPRQLTDLARSRARQAQPTWAVAVGTADRPAIATLRIAHTREGVEEHITLALGYAADERAPIELLPQLAESLAARHNLATMISELRAARADLATPAHYEPPPIPVSLTLGPDAVADLGISHARNALPACIPTQLGPAGRPALHYPLGDGTDPAAWQRLRRIDEHLKGGSGAATRPS